MGSASKIEDFVAGPKDQAWIKEVIHSWGYDLPDDGSLAALQADVIELGVDDYLLKLPDDTEVRQKAICKRFLKAMVDAKTMDPPSPPGVVESVGASEEPEPASEAPKEIVPSENRNTDYYVTLHHLAPENQDFRAHVTVRFREGPPAHYTIPSFCCTTVRLDATTTAIDVRTNNAHDSLAGATHTFDVTCADAEYREDGMNFYIFSDTQLALQTEQEKGCFKCLCLTCIYPPLGAIILILAGLINLVMRALRPRQMVINFEPGEKGGKLDRKESSVLHFLRHGAPNQPQPIDIQDEKTGTSASFTLWSGQSHVLSRASGKKVTWHSPGKPGPQAFDAAPFANRHVYLLLQGAKRCFAPAVCIGQRILAPEEDQFWIHLHHVAPGGKDLQAKVRVRSKNGSTVSYELVGTNHTTIRLCNVKTLEVESRHSDGTILVATAIVDVAAWAPQLKQNGTNVYVFSDVMISPWTEREKQDWWNLWCCCLYPPMGLIMLTVAWCCIQVARSKRPKEVDLRINEWPTSGGRLDTSCAAWHYLDKTRSNQRLLLHHTTAAEEPTRANRIELSHAQPHLLETSAEGSKVHFRSGKKFSVDMAEFIGYHTYVVKDKDNSVTVLRGASITEEDVEAGLADTEESNQVSNKPASNQATSSEPPSNEPSSNRAASSDG